MLALLYDTLLSLTLSIGQSDHLHLPTYLFLSRNRDICLLGSAVPQAMTALVQSLSLGPYSSTASGPHRRLTPGIVFAWSGLLKSNKYSSAYAHLGVVR